MAWRVREGMFGLVGRLRPPGTALIIEDVCVAARADRRVRPRDIQALLGEHGFLTGVAGHASAGNLHFMLTPDFAKPEDRERYEAFMEQARRADRRQVRRLAEGRARHRGQHGAVRRARVGREGDGDDVAGQGSSPTPTACSRPGVRPQPRPRRPPAQPEDDAADRGGGDDLRRVRVLRAGLPEPQPDDDAAPADRPAPRDGAPAGGLAGARGAARASTSTTGSRPAPPTAPAQLACPLAIDTGKLIKALPRARAHRRARSAWRCARRGAGPRVERARARRAARRATASARASATRRSRGAAALRGGRQRRAGPGLAARTCRRPRRRELPATRARGRRRRLPAGLHQPDLRQRRAATARGPTPARGAGRGLARAPGCPLWIPADVAGHCCATPWSSKGYRDGARARWRARPLDALWRWSDGGRAAGRHRRQLVRARAGQEVAAQLERRAARAPRASSRCSTRSPGRTTACCRELEVARRLGVGRRPPDLLGRATSASTPKLERARRRARRRGRRPAAARRAAGWPATAACCTPSCPPSALRDEAARARRARARRLPVLEPHLRDRPPAGHRPPLRVVRLPARAPHPLSRLPPSGGFTAHDTEYPPLGIGGCPDQDSNLGPTP